jgi:ATP-dependent endonuclease of the OLD family-like protein
MKLREIKIQGYKSIDKLNLPVRKYGKDDNESYTTILIGKNETGKSNALDAMATPKCKGEVSFDKIQNQQKEPKRVSIFFDFSIEDTDDYRSAIKQVITMPDELADEINITKITKEIYLQSNLVKYDVDYDYEMNEITDNKYSFIETAAESVPSYISIQEKDNIIKLSSDLTDEEKTSHTQLTSVKLKDIIKSALRDFVSTINVPVDYWAYQEKYLIEGKVNLKTFADDPNVNVPLKNMFYLAGCKDQSEIKSKIDEIEKADNKRRRLMKKISSETTRYLNDKWKEHEIDIEVEIESSTLELSVVVKDKCDTDSYYDMTDRSQGFKQFVSLLLSLSIGSTSGDIENHLILIDEPEVHLHPSGVRWMLKELIEIGKRNYLFISTHSNFMLDKNTRERHYLLTKNKAGLTEAHHITSSEDINDDEILQSAFGINVITDFLTPYTLLVEGATDKKILQKALKQVKSDNDVLITNGTGANIVAVSSYLLLNNITPMVIVDDDRDGKEYKKKIIKIGDDFKSKTFTIRDLNGNITVDGTMEDTLPIEFVESKTKEVLNMHSLNNDITLNDTEPFCYQIIKHYTNITSGDTATSKKDKKSKLDIIMTDIKTKIAEYDQRSITQTKTPRLYALSEEILKKFGIN